ncbi:MAG: cell wall-binding repeat-containing protein [Bacillota bacterium]|nr:cell wall-binding repeat-containing protein [Bacillota bacterium]
MKKLFAWVVAVAVGCGVFSGFSGVANALSEYYRVSGQDRISTAIEISMAGWEQSDIVILARSNNPADALAAASLAGTLEAPILLTPTDTLPEKVSQELYRLDASEVIILGGTAAISDNVLKSLKKQGYFTERVSGTNRFETAAKINEVAGTSRNTKAIVVNGYTVADAISASSPSAINGIPIYLATDSKLPVALPANIKEVTIFGGEKVVGKSVLKELENKGIKVTRIAGANRYQTNILSLDETLTDNVLIVRGTSVSKTKEDYPDAVTASGLAKVWNANMILANPSKVVPEVEEHFSTNRYIDITVIGGESAVSSEVVWESTAYVDTELKDYIEEKMVDVAIHPTKPIIYYTNTRKAVKAFNYENGTVNTLHFDEEAESIYFANNKLYVSLLKGEHSSYWWEEDQEGAIAVINADTFTVDKRLEVNIDPYDIVVDSKGFIYIASGSGQHTHLNSYDQHGTHLSTQWIYESTNIELAPGEDKIFAVDTVISPRDMTVYHLSGDGQISNYKDSPYHGDYDLDTKIRVSADGKYVFNNAGYVFNAEGLELLQELAYDFTDVVSSSDSFFLGRNGLLLGYSTGNFEEMDRLSTHGDVHALLQNKDDIVIISHFYEDESTVPLTGVEVFKKNWFVGEFAEKKVDLNGEEIN